MTEVKIFAKTGSIGFKSENESKLFYTLYILCDGESLLLKK